MTRFLIPISWLMLLCAVAAWAGVGFFAYSIITMRDTRAVQLQQSQDASSQVSQSISRHALVVATAADRAQLQSLATVDPASLAAMIDDAGAVRGVAIQISDAVSENPLSGNVGAVQPFGFTAVAQGVFGDVRYAAEVLEMLPAPSSLVQLELIAAPQVSGSTQPAARQWQMNAQVKVLSASASS